MKGVLGIGVTKYRNATLPKMGGKNERVTDSKQIHPGLNVSHGPFNTVFWKQLHEHKLWTVEGARKLGHTERYGRT